MIRRDALLALVPMVLAAASAAAFARAQDPGRVPVITFDSTEHDFGTVSDTRPLRTTYTFTNTGNAELVIRELKATCACLSPSVDRLRFAPGERGTITLDLDLTGRSSSGAKTFLVMTNAGDVPVKLRARYAMRPLLKLSYGPIDVGTVRLGETFNTSITATHSDPELRLVSVETGHPHVHATAVQGTDGPSDEGLYQATIELRIDSEMPWGSLQDLELAVVVHGTPVGERAAIDYTYRKPIEGNIYGLIHATALTYRSRITPRSVIDVGPLNPGQGFQQSVQLAHVERGRAWMVGVEAAPPEEGFVAIPDLVTRTQANGPTGYQVHVSGSAPEQLGPFRGRVLVNTTVPGEEAILVTVVGEVTDEEIAVQGSAFRNFPH